MGPKKEKKMKINVSDLTTKLFLKCLPVLAFSLIAQILFMPSTSWGVENTTVQTPHTEAVVATSTTSSKAQPEAKPHHAPKAHGVATAPCPPAAKPHHAHHAKKVHVAHHPKKAAPIKKAKPKKKITKKKTAKKKPVRKVAHHGHIWGTLSYARPRDYFLLSETKSRLYSGVIGVDYTLTPQVSVGLYYSNGYNKSRSPLTQLVNRSRGRADSNSFFANAIYNFSPSFYFNFVVGYSYTPNKNITYDRRGTGLTVAKTKTNVFSISPSINASRNIGNFTVASQLGYGHSNAYRGRARDSNGRVLVSSATYTDSAFFFADFSYNFKKVTGTIDKIAPFVNIGLDHGFQTPKPKTARNRLQYTRSQDGWKAGTGLRFLVANDVSINAGWTISRGRTKQNSQLVSLTVRVGAF